MSTSPKSGQFLVFNFTDNHLAHETKIYVERISSGYASRRGWLVSNLYGVVTHTPWEKRASLLTIYSRNTDPKPESFRCSWNGVLELPVNPIDENGEPVDQYESLRFGATPMVSYRLERKYRGRVWYLSRTLRDYNYGHGACE